MHQGEVGCTTSSFICLAAGAIEWHPYFFATILLLYALPRVTSVLVLFVIFGGLFIRHCVNNLEIVGCKHEPTFHGF